MDINKALIEAPTQIITSVVDSAISETTRLALEPVISGMESAISGSLNMLVNIFIGWF